MRHAPLAQLDRASGYGPEGRGFESLTACHPETVEIKRFRGFSFALLPVCIGTISNTLPIYFFSTPIAVAGSGRVR